mgnify:CR=1 FL=1
MYDDTQLARAQDDLRPVRMFVGALQGALAADQSIVGMDGYAFNVPGQYQVIGPYGYSLEGRPISTTQGGGLVISPAIVMMGLGAAIFFLASK